MIDHAPKIRVHPLAPVYAFDIDGTLGDYYEHFRWFAQLYLQKPVVADWSRARFSGEFSDALGLDKELYRDIKLAYRQGGMKRSLPPLDDGVSDLIQSVRGLGVQAWITTTRPWQRLDNIDPDTQFWINHIVGKVDGVIYGEDKYLDLIDIVGRDRILGLVDDLPENILRASELDLAAIMRHGAHNRQFREMRPETLVATHSVEIYNHVRIQLEVYKEHQK